MYSTYKLTQIKQEDHFLLCAINVSKTSTFRNMLYYYTSIHFPVCAFFKQQNSNFPKKLTKIIFKCLKLFIAPEQGNFYIKFLNAKFTRANSFKGNFF